MKKVLIYSSQYCPYCIRAKMLLEQKAVQYTEIDVNKNPKSLKEMMDKAKRHTVPQIFIGDTHIGGCDELFALERSNKLNNLLGIN